MKSTSIRHGLAVLAVLCAQAAVAVPMDPALERLRRGDFAGVEQHFHALQTRFEAGTLSEFDLRQAYRPLYDLDDEAFGQLKAWAAAAPSSYPAHLLLGIHYKRRGDAARGDKFIADTSREAIDDMHRQFRLAAEELKRSTQLTAKPYLSWFFMMSITMQEGTPAESRAILDKSVTQYPLSELLRVRYIQTLTPRWGGSYDQMEAFIARSRKEGMPDRVVHELQAMEEDAMGHDRSDAGDERAARAHAEKALALARDSAPFFREDSLEFSKWALCRAPSRSANCP